MAAEVPSEDDNVIYTFATWVYLLHTAGIEPSDGALAERCASLDAVTDAAEGDTVTAAFVERVSEVLDGARGPDEVAVIARALYGDQVGGELGEGSRGDRTHRIRKYQFGRSLPWLARIWERHPDGSVAPSWLLVRQLTDEVEVMDPNPWNDVDEERALPVGDFLVLWELDDCTAIHVRSGAG